MRFDDALSTILAGDTESGFGATATWRQLVDLLGRRRVPTEEPLLARLRLLRQAVPVETRAASARALAFAAPNGALVGFFAEDELAVAAPVLRMVELSAAEWLTLLPRLPPPLRSVLRHRRDLPAEVTRALESFGSVDFVLPEPANDGAIDAALPLSSALPPIDEAGIDAATVPAPKPDSMAPADAIDATPTPVPTGGYAISDLVARIEAFNRRKTTPGDDEVSPRPLATTFRFATDAGGTIRWVDGVPRAAIVGVSIATGAEQGLLRVDGIVTGAFRRRSRFDDARLVIGGRSDAAGSWRVSGMPQFDADTGRFTGFQGAARRPRPDEDAAPARPSRAGIDSLRQLVHELRTPTNAISGFAELIETQLLGPVSPTYRARAGTIRAHAADLLSAIEDLDTAARIEGHALDLRPAQLRLAPVLTRILTDVEPLAAIRGASLAQEAVGADVKVAADEIAVERLIGRMIAAALSVARPGERIGISADASGRDVTIRIDRPAALIASPGKGTAFEALEVGEGIDGVAGMPLLGTAFALRLARNLAAELGGDMSIGSGALTLRLPAALDQTMEQATTL